jgi:hypothetical protein
MNKNSLRQIIVTEMILADVNGGGHVPPKKRSLLEMMDDSYLSELEDGRFAHSMESVEKLFEEVPKDNWTVTDPKTGEKRAPKTSGPRSEKQQAAIDAAKAAWKTTKDAAVAAQPSSAPADDDQASQNQDNDEPLPTDPTNPAVPMSIPQGNPDSDGGGDTPQTGLTTPDLTTPPVEVEDPPVKKSEPIDVNFTETDEDSNNKKPGNGDSDGDQDAQGSSDDSAPSGGLAYLDTLAQAEVDAALGAADSDNMKESRLSLIGLLYDT